MLIRKIILLLLFCCLGFGGRGQAIVQRFYDYVVPGSLIKSNTGSVFMSGTVNNPPILEYQAFLSKLDSVGHPVWTMGYRDTSSYKYYIIQKSKQLSNGDFIHGMLVGDTTNNLSQAFLKTDSAGNFKSAHKFIFQHGAYAYDFTEDNDGNFVFAGHIDYGYINVYSDSRFLLFKTDSLFNMIWSKEYAAFVDDHFRSIDIFADGNYLLQGNYEDTTDYFGNPNNYGRRDVCVLKIDTAGNIVWSKLAGNPLFPNPSGIPDASAYPCKAIVANDGTILNGFSCDWYANQFSGGKGDIMIQRLNSNGNEIACHRYGDQTYGYERLKDFNEDSNGNIVFSSQQLLFKSNYFLNREWIRYVRPINIDPSVFAGFYDFYQAQESTYNAISLSTTGAPSYNRYACYILTDSLGISGCNNQIIGFFFDQPETPGTFDITNRFTGTTIAVIDSNINVNSLPILLGDSISCDSFTDVNEKAKFAHIKVYPNPATSTLRIAASVNNYTVTVTDVAGRKINTITASAEKTSIDISGLTKGLYFITVKNGNELLKQAKISKQ